MRSLTPMLAATGLSALMTLAVQSETKSIETQKLETRDFTIPSPEPGIQLFMREKHPAGVTKFAPDKILLYVHGATYPSETAFDLPIDGKSMMDLIAERGYDVFLVDVRGYGRSTRPPQMAHPPMDNPPFADTRQAAADLAAAADYVRKERGADKIDLIGWSWGTAISGLYASQNSDKLHRLVLYAPIWLPEPLPGEAKVAKMPPLGAYRTVTRAEAKARWLKDVPADKQAGLIQPGVFEAWADATWATDPEAGKHEPPMLRAPNGVMASMRGNWFVGKPEYDPGAITVPTLILHAEWDADLPSYMSQALFKKLTNAPYRRFIELSEGTHTVMMEKNRMQFFHELIGFLDEPEPAVR